MYLSLESEKWNFQWQFFFCNKTNCCALLHEEGSKTNEWTRILMSSKNFNDSQSDNPCTVSRTNGRKQMLKQELSIQSGVLRSN